LVKNSGALDRLQHLPLAWRKKEENALSETLYYTVCLCFAATQVCNDVQSIFV